MSRRRLVVVAAYSVIYWATAAIVWSPHNPLHGYAAIGFASLGASVLTSGLVLQGSSYILWLIVSWTLPAFVLAFAFPKRFR